MNKLPEHIREQLERLIKEGLPANEIAFMMRLNIEAVNEAIEAQKTKVLNTTK